VLHALVTPAEDAGLREAALAFDEAMRHGDDFLTPEQHSALRALRAALSRQAEKETA
jgi:hypothetical protein